MALLIYNSLLFLIIPACVQAIMKVKSEKTLLHVRNIR